MSTKKKKQKWIKLVFGRTGVIIALLILQIGLLLLYNAWLQEYKAYLTSIMGLFRFLAVVWVVNDKTEPSFRMTWLVIIVAAPVFGVTLYLYVKMQVGTKALNRRLMNIIRETKHLLRQDEQVMVDLMQVSPLTARLGN